jgi:hypothetical protein
LLELTTDVAAPADLFARLARGDELAGRSSDQEWRGTARVLELDAATGVAVLGARAERRFSSVDATVTLSMQGGGVLRVTAVLHPGGGAAQLGVEHLLEDFAATLPAILDRRGPAPAVPAAPPRPPVRRRTAAGAAAALGFACGALAGRGLRRS